MIKFLWKWSACLRRVDARNLNGDQASNEFDLYSESEFRKRLLQERKRAERSDKPVILVLLQLEGAVLESEELLINLFGRLATCVRETDTCGHVEGNRVLGVILTEVEPEMVESAKRAVAAKIKASLEQLLHGSETTMQISFKLFPEREGGAGGRDPVWYPEVVHERISAMEVAKRSIDILGSLAGLLIFAPLFVILPVIIKINSRGPAFFRQQRVGCNGVRFDLIKFRSMYMNNDDIVHRNFVTSLIRDTAAASRSVYKIQGDARVTAVGRVLRKYSVDEVPQFINVLKGEMSLVGPRPPIEYEVEHYFPWQLCRIMGRKPGITGLWQVTGRSTTSFDEMVRLDLQYVRNWSLKMDLKLLLLTPAAVLKCKGAY